MTKNWYEENRAELIRQKGSDTAFPFGKDYPCINDRDKPAGEVTAEYFLQDLYVAQKIFKKNPRKHLDVGSRVDGFIANVATFREIYFTDIRPLNVNVKNIKFIKIEDEIWPLNLKFDSVSCLHVVEHCGLGRYGDKIDYHGHVKVLNNIHDLLEPGGMFYLSVPLGRQRIEWNAHRYFSFDYMMGLLGGFRIEKFSFIANEKLTENINIANGFICEGLGIFELRKI